MIHILLIALLLYSAHCRLLPILSRSTYRALLTKIQAKLIPIMDASADPISKITSAAAVGSRFHNHSLHTTIVIETAFP